MMRKQHNDQACPAPSGTAGRNAPSARVSSFTTPSPMQRDIDAEIFSSNNSYDTRGRCVRHPYNRLRKKKLFGGWKVLMTACPDCCMEELLGIYREDTKSSGKKEARGDAEKSDVRSSCSTEASTATAPSHSYHPQNGEGMPQQRKDNDDTIATCSTGGSSVHSAQFSRPYTKDDVPRQNVARGSPNGGSGTRQRSRSFGPRVNGVALVDSSQSPDRGSGTRQRGRSVGPRVNRAALDDNLRQAVGRNQQRRHVPPGALPANAKPTISPRPIRSTTSPSIAPAKSKECEKNVLNVGRMERTDAHGSSGCDASFRIPLPVRSTTSPGIAPPKSKEYEKSAFNVERMDYTDALGSSGRDASFRISPLPVRSATSPGIAPAAFHVERMEYADARGGPGRYSGAVDRRFLPHGHGVMEYGNGLKVMGDWKNGQLGLSQKGESRLSSSTATGRFESGGTSRKAQERIIFNI